jgi:acyl dehydratase
MNGSLFEAGSAEVAIAEPVTRTQIVQYAGVSGDFNPVHTDESYAVATGRPTVLAHGMLTMGLAGTALQRLLPSGTRVLHFSCRFREPVWPGDVLRARFAIDSTTQPENDVEDIRLEVHNQNEAVVLVGRAQVRKAE